MASSGKQSAALRAIDIGRRPALAQIVEERLREAIMFGELSLGEPISEDKMASRLGVSRTPVREALSALQVQGLVTIQPQRGSYVFTPAETDIDEICDYRLWVESRALALAHRRNKEATLRELEQAQAAMERAELVNSPEDAARADAAFHNAFIDHCGNSLLIRAYSLVSGRVGAIRFFARKSGGARNYAGSQHRDIIAAFREDQLDVATAILQTHIMNMRTHYMEAKIAQHGS